MMNIRDELKGGKWDFIDDYTDPICVDTTPDRAAFDIIGLLEGYDGNTPILITVSVPKVEGDNEHRENA